MNTRHVILIASLLIVLCMENAASQPRNCYSARMMCDSIQNVDVIGINWTIHSLIDITVPQVLRSQEAYRVSIIDTTLLRDLSNALCEQIKSSLNIESIDVRIVCLISTDKGGDTLAFGKSYMRYRGLTYETSTTLLKIIAPWLPSQQREIINQLIEILESDNINEP